MGIRFLSIITAMALAAIFTSAIQTDAQTSDPLPELIPTPPSQTSQPTSPFATTDSTFVLESSQFAPAFDYSADCSATIAPVNAGELGKVIAIEEQHDLFAEPGSRGFFVQIDGFLWRESIQQHGKRCKLLEESGPIFSIGYQARKPRQRYRVAIFGGSTDYDGATWDNEPLASKTDYIGVVGEYDFRWPLFGSPTNGFFAGVGTRWWSRNLQNSVTEYGNLSLGYKETWWTIYPRIGLDSMLRLRNGMHLYMSGSLGYTAYTSENIDFLDVTLQPESDVYTRAEIGLRNNRLMLSLMLEHFGWRDSDDENGVYQPRSTMLTAGMLFGYNF